MNTTHLQCLFTWAPLFQPLVVAPGVKYWKYDKNTLNLNKQQRNNKHCVMVIVFLEQTVGGFVWLTFWQNLFQSWYLGVCANYVILFLFLIFLEEGGCLKMWVLCFVQSPTNNVQSRWVRNGRAVEMLTEAAGMEDRLPQWRAFWDQVHRRLYKFLLQRWWEQKLSWP